MKSDLILNPFTQILFNDNSRKPLFDAQPEADYFLVAPVPQEELKFTGISKLEQPNLYDLFLDLSKTQLDFLDINHDLNAAERDFLYANGILVEADKAPQKPLFYCLLDEVQAPEFSGSAANLIINPSFRFEPFSFENLVTWVHEKHLSPYQPSAWIERPASKIQLGYWLAPEQAKTVSEFQPGKKPGIDIETELLAKLIEAEILIQPEWLSNQIESEQKIIENARADFQIDKYFVLRQLLPPAQMFAMRRFYRQYVEQGFMPFGDAQVNRRFRQVDEPLAGFFHRNFTQLMSLLAGEKVKPSYVFAASYKEFADLKPHTDRKQCEFSISFQVDYQPEAEDFMSPWAIFIARPDFDVNFDKPYFNPAFPAPGQDSETNRPIFLASGDALFYKGCEVVHYRYELPAGHQSTSLFFHYVPEDFEEDFF